MEESLIGREMREEESRGMERNGTEWKCPVLIVLCLLMWADMRDGICAYASFCCFWDEES